MPAAPPRLSRGLQGLWRRPQGQTPDEQLKKVERGTPTVSRNFTSPRLRPTHTSTAHAAPRPGDAAAAVPRAPRESEPGLSQLSLEGEPFSFFFCLLLCFAKLFLTSEPAQPTNNHVPRTKLHSTPLNGAEPCAFSGTPEARSEHSRRELRPGGCGFEPAFQQHAWPTTFEEVFKCQ